MKNYIQKRKTILICILLLGSVFPLQNCKKECDYNTDTYPYSCKGGMDVAFLIDYTGSMGPAINDVKTNVASIVSTIITESAGDYRLSLSIFDEINKAGTPSYISTAEYTSLPAAQKILINTGSLTNQYLTMMEPFGVTNNTTFSAQLAKLNTVLMPLGSGAGGPEPGGLLADKIVNNNFANPWRIGKTKFLIIITDAQDGGDDDTANAVDDAFLTTLANNANANQIQVILISTLASSNYELKLINAYPSRNYKTITTSFQNVSSEINKIIQNVCVENVTK